MQALQDYFENEELCELKVRKLDIMVDELLAFVFSDVLIDYNPRNGTVYCFHDKGYFHIPSSMTIRIVNEWVYIKPQSDNFSEE